jgi:hypothetical protein
MSRMYVTLEGNWGAGLGFVRDRVTACEGLKEVVVVAV